MQNTLIVNKSKFLSFRFDIKSKDEFNAHYKEMQAKYPDATHICYAYITENGSQGGMSDAGEPSGSVGRPLMNFLQIKKQTNTCVFVVRYYGGVKLGKGHLTRAYVNSVKVLY